MNDGTDLGISHASGIKVIDHLGPVVHGDTLRHFVIECQRPFVTKFRRNTPMETIGDRVRRLREAKGIARKDLARDADLSYTGLSDLESGKAKSTTKLHRLADALGVDVNYLETGRGSARVLALSPSAQSQPARLDVAMIRETVKAIRTHEARHGRAFDIESEEGAALFVHWYGRRSELTDPVAMLDNLIELETRRDQDRAKGADANGRKESLPVTGTDERKRPRQGRRNKK